jgi:drug/metabolite transporter (DMT)-like permease
MLGIIGVAVLVGGGPLALNLEVAIAVLALLLAACSYSAATVYAKRHLSGLPTAYAATVQLLGAAVLLAAPAVWAAPASRPSSTAIINLSALILVSTTFAYLLYFFLLRELGPTRTASVTFLIPMFGTFWAIVFLDEPFSAGMFLGMAIILASVRLVIGVPINRRSLERPPSVFKKGEI